MTNVVQYLLNTLTFISLRTQTVMRIVNCFRLQPLLYYLFKGNSDATMFCQKFRTNPRPFITLAPCRRLRYSKFPTSSASLAIFTGIQCVNSCTNAPSVLTLRWRSLASANDAWCEAGFTCDIFLHPFFFLFF